MANPKSAWGIDVGNRALKAIKLVRSGSDVKIDQVDVIEHEHVLSNSGDNRETLIQSALAAFAQRHGDRGVPVAVGVSGQSSFARFIKLPPVDTKKIPEIVRFEAIQQIPFPLDEVEWSYQLFKQDDSPEVEVGIFAMRKELVSTYVKYFTNPGMNVQVVQTNPLAVYNAMQHDGRLKDGTTLIVDLGAEHTDLIIAEGEQIWLRPIPIGGNNFTETLVKAFKLRFEKAEELKRNAATSKYGRQILQAMKPVFSDLVSEIQRSVGFYSSVHRDSKITKVIALGGTFRLPGLQKYLQQNLQLDVQRVDKLDGGAPADAQSAAMLDENLLSSAAAYGLALQAMGEAKITSSLLPTEIRRERMWKDKTKWFITATAACVAGLVLVPFATYQMAQMQYNEASGRRAEISEFTTNVKDLDTKWKSLEEDGKTEREQIQSILELTKGRGYWGPMTVALASAMPVPDQRLRTRDVAQIKSIPRDQRNIVWVDEWVTQYTPNIGPFLRMSLTEFLGVATDRGQAASISQSFMPPPQPQPPSLLDDMAAAAAKGETDATKLLKQDRGFIVTLWCTTPSRDYQAIALKIVEDLKKNGLPENVAKPAEGMKFKIGRVELKKAQRIVIGQTQGGSASVASLSSKMVDPNVTADGSATTKPTEPVRQSAPAGFFGQPGQSLVAQPNVPGQEAPQAADQGMEMPNIGELLVPVTEDPSVDKLMADTTNIGYIDPITHEITKNDYELQFVIAVILEPSAATTQPSEKKETPKDAAQQTASADASH